VRFIAAGSESAEISTADLELSIDLLGIRDRLQIIGQISGEEKWHVLRHANAIVFPSSYQYEAQPLVLIEALSVGTPAVAFDVGDVRSIVVNEYTGFLVKAGAGEDLVRALQDFKTVDHEKIRRNCLDHYSRVFQAKLS